MRSPIRYFSLSWFATAVMVVACGPQKDYLPVVVEAGSPLLKALSECRAQVSQTKMVRVGGSGPTNPICEFVIRDQQSPDGSVPRQIGAYELVDREVSYSLSRRGDRLVAKLRVGLELPPNTPDRVKTGIGQILYGCVQKVDQIWQRSMKNRSLGLEIELATPRPELKGQLDQQFSLKASSENGSVSDSEYPSFEMAHWPERAKIYPLGQRIAGGACEDGQLNSPGDRENCRKAIEEAKLSAFKANQKFCVDFAMMVGLWVGLQADATVQEPCQTPMVPNQIDLASGVIVNNKGRKGGTGFMEAAARWHSQHFFDSSKLSSNDIQTIFKPLCRESFDKLGRPAGPKDGPVGLETLARDEG
jgi:hypothetical protein